MSEQLFSSDDDDMFAAALHKEEEMMKNKQSQNQFQGEDPALLEKAQEEAERIYEQAQRANSNNNWFGKPEEPLPSKDELIQKSLDALKLEEKGNNNLEVEKGENESIYPIPEAKSSEQEQAEKEEEEKSATLQREIEEGNRRFLSEETQPASQPKEAVHIAPIGTEEKPVLKPTGTGQVLNAPVLWAQRPDQIYISIPLPDIKDARILVEETKLSFVGTSGGKSYQAELEFFGEIDPSRSKYIIRARSVDFVLIRKESGAYWARLLQGKGKPNWLKVDWNKWVDEDEAEDDTGFDMGGMEGLLGGGPQGMDMDALSRMMANNPSLEEQADDDEEEDIPGLEKDEENPEDQSAPREEEFQEVETQSPLTEKGQAEEEEEIPPLENP
jgi:prostaglandin-E synthase